MADNGVSDADPVLDPWENLTQLFYFVVNVILRFFVNFFPIIVIGFLIILSVFYLIFRLNLTPLSRPIFNN